MDTWVEEMAGISYSYCYIQTGVLYNLHKTIVSMQLWQFSRDSRQTLKIYLN
jgi:hypothetical protein